ncbi:MAG: flagellar type III secretion system protein FlhB [Nannocystaceae bacterium]
MSEASSAEKTEEPTGKRRNEFRRDGNIARSPDIGGVTILSGTLILILFSGEGIYAGLDLSFRDAFGSLDTREPARTAITSAMIAAGITAIHACGGIFLCSGILGVCAGIAQTGGNFTTKVFEVKASKFNPITGLKNLFFGTQKLEQVGLSIVKAIVLGTILAIILRGSFTQLLALCRMPVLSSLAFIGTLVLRLIIATILATAVLAVIDYVLAHRRIHKQMKMTKQEVKDERKQAEGDPQVKNRLRKRMLEIGYNQMLAATAKADVVLVNPTHFAVALAYDPMQNGAPRLLAKGKDAVAFRIREVARRHQIPVVSNPSVTRAVYHTAKVGAEIPVDLYEIVARVLAYVYRTSGRSAA